MSNRVNFKRTIIITGANSGLGYECARSIAKNDKEAHIVFACRDKIRAETSIKKLINDTGNDSFTYLNIDLSSLDSVRNFVMKYRDLDLPPLYAIVCNAGVTVVGDRKYTVDGIELTFGVNHLSHFLLCSMLLSDMTNSGRIVFVSSNTHDPTKRTGMPEPVYIDAKSLAFPKSGNNEDNVLIGRVSYTTSKLCNIYCAYELAERIKKQKDIQITINAFDPGMMPGTDLARDYGKVIQLVWKYIFPVLTATKLNINTPKDSGTKLASLVIDNAYSGITGKYFEGNTEIKSSELSYNAANRKNLWATSIELSKLKQCETILKLDE